MVIWHLGQNKGKGIESVLPFPIFEYGNGMVIELTVSQEAFEDHDHVGQQGDVLREIILFVGNLVKEGCDYMKEEGDPPLGSLQCTEFDSLVSEVWLAVFFRKVVDTS